MMKLSLWGGKPLWDGYRLRRRRGKGSFGEVWEAETKEEEPIALKFLPCRDPITSAKELRNIRAIQELSHPNLLKTQRVWSSQGYVVISMELADGSLNDVLGIAQAEHGGGLSQNTVCAYLAEAADALDFLNARRHSLGAGVVGIQHCDIKPGNLLVVGERLKVCDFGLATQMSAPLVSHSRAGTTAYAAHEIFDGQLSDWSDQFALAVTYCELRGGRLPYPRTPSRFDRAYVHPDPDLTMLTAGEAQVIRRALSRVPQDRWSNCGEMMKRLSALVSRRNDAVAVAV